MSEPINKIMASCHTHLSTYADRPDNLTYYEFDRKKFAELIILKCAEIVDEAVMHRRPASEYSTVIKKYFGLI